MDLFITIFTTVTLPIFVLIVTGYALQTFMSFSLDTLNRLLVNVVLPAFLVHFIATSELDLARVLDTIWFTTAQFLLLLGVGWGIAKLLRFEATTVAVVALAFALPNTGNFGVPVARLAFAPEWVLHQVTILSTHTILIVIAVVALLRSPDGPKQSALDALIKSPMIWGVVVGAVLAVLKVPLPGPLEKPMAMLAGTYVPFALFTLGAALAGRYERFEMGPLSVMVIGKLALCPAITWAVAYAFGFRGELLSLLVVAAAAPTGVLLAILTLQAGTKPRLAAASVFLTTLLSPLLVTAWIVTMRLLN